MARRQILQSALLLTALLLGGCGAPSEPGSLSVPSAGPVLSAAREPIELIILHTNDNWGETEPCG